MADIAQIGFRADTADLSIAEQKLKKLVPAAAGAERASDKLAQSFDENASSAGRAAAGIDGITAATRRASSVPIVKQFISPWQTGSQQIIAANDNIVKSMGAMKANTANIAAQFQDIGVTAAMGMSPLQIALQQGTQLAAIFASSGESAFKTIGGAIRQVISPTALLTIGIIALVAAGLQFINWVSVAQTGLNIMADVLPVIAEGAVYAGAALALAFAPAIAASIWSITIALASGLLLAIGAIVSTVGAIPLAIGLIVADLIIFRDAWTQTLGVDLVGAVKTGVNYVIGAFVGAYHDIEFLWKQFPDVIGAAAVGAANLAIRAVNAIIGVSISGLNALLTTINTLISLGPVGKALGVSGPLDMVDPADYQFEEMANEAADRLAKAVGQRNKQLQDDLTFDYLGAMGGAIADAAGAASDKLREIAGGLGAGDAGKTKKGGKTETERFEDIVNGAERTIAALQAERDAVGLSAEAAARLKYETQLLNEAKQKNIDLSPAQRAALMGLAGDMARLEVATAKAKEALDFSKDLLKGFVGDLRSGLEQGKSFWESFADAALNALDKIVDKLLNDVIDALFEVNKAGSNKGSGGILGFLGDLLGGIFGGGSSDPWAGLRFAKGGTFVNGISGHSNSVVDHPTLFAFASGAGLMGEAGPEAVMPLTRGPDGTLGVQQYGGGSGGGSVVYVEPHISVSVDGARGNAEIREMVSEGVQAGLQQFNDEVLPARVQDIADHPRVR